MDRESTDQRIRAAAFEFLRRLTLLHGEVVPAAELRSGFVFEGQQVPLMGPQGIFKPKIMEWPLSITTVPVLPGRPRPYQDGLSPEGLLLYRYRGDDPQHRDNRGLREAMVLRLPLVYLFGVAPGRYLPEWPVFVEGDDRERLTFTVGFDDALASEVEPVAELPEEARRAYATRVVWRRLHQQAFKDRVLRAYDGSCAMCRLHHSDLLDAAHILSDRHPRGDPVTANGLALCKLHHAAFDRNLLGVRPDLVMELRRDLRDEVDGPMLVHGLQELQGRRLAVLPRARGDRPDQDRLEERYGEFLAAG